MTKYETPRMFVLRPDHDGTVKLISVVAEYTYCCHCGCCGPEKVLVTEDGNEHYASAFVEVDSSAYVTALALSYAKDQLADAKEVFDMELEDFWQGQVKSLSQALFQASYNLR